MQAAVRTPSAQLFLTHNHTCSPLIRQARAMVAQRLLGDLRVVQAEYAHILLRLAGGARGMLWASQVAVGCENGLRLRVYGSEGALDWRQENPNQLRYTPLGQPTQT